MAFLVFSGRASKKFATEVVAGLGVSLGEPSISRFSDGEPHYAITDTNITDQDVVVIQSTSSPVERNYFDLWGLLTSIQDRIDRGEKPRSVVVVMGFIGFRRQERSTEIGEAVMAKTMIQFLKTLPVTHVVLVDPHSPALVEFFDPLPVTVLDTTQIKARMIQEMIERKQWSRDALRVIAPDQGRHDGGARLSELLNLPLIRFRKERPEFNQTRVTGSDDTHVSVANCICIINDDEIDTGSTVMGVGQQLLSDGAKGLVILVTHGVLSGNAVVKIKKHPAVITVAISDTIYLPWENRTPKIEVFSVVPEIVSHLQEICSKTKS